MTRRRWWVPFVPAVTRYARRGALICDDCGASDGQGRVPGFTSPITTDGQARVYCPACKERRGFAFLFDARSWREIVAASQQPTDAA